MPLPLPSATIRTQVSVPLRFADGYTTAARVFSFDGLVDGLENLAFGLGDRAAAVTLRWARTGAAGPAAQRVPHRRRLRQPALRLRPAAAGVGRADRRLRWVPALPAAGRTWHRPVRQARRLRAAGHRAGHLRGERRAGARRGRAQLPGRRTDAAGPRGVARGPAEQQPGQGPPAPPVRGDGGRPGADGRAPVRRERPLPGDEGAPRRTHARGPEVSGLSCARARGTAGSEWLPPRFSKTAEKSRANTIVSGTARASVHTNAGTPCRTRPATTSSYTTTTMGPCVRYRL